MVTYEENKTSINNRLKTKIIKVEKEQAKKHRSVRTELKEFEGVPVTVRKRYTLKVGGMQLRVIWLYRCKLANGKCKGEWHYTELGFGPSIVKRKNGKYIDGNGKEYTLRDMFEIAEHQAFTRDSILCSPCEIKLHSINLLKNVRVKRIQDIDAFNKKDKPPIQKFDFKLPVTKGIKLLKEIYGQSINYRDYKILHEIAIGKLHISDADKRHERIFVKYGKIIHYIDEQENQKRIKKQEHNSERARKKRKEKAEQKKEKKEIDDRLKNRIQEKTLGSKKLPIRKIDNRKTTKLSKNVKKALKEYYKT